MQVKKMYIFGNVLVFLLLFISTISYAKLPVGMNTNEIQHLDSSAPFVNVFKMAMPFKDAKKLTHGHIQFDKESLVGPVSFSLL